MMKDARPRAKSLECMIEGERQDWVLPIENISYFVLRHHKDADEMLLEIQMKDGEELAFTDQIAVALHRRLKESFNCS
jgi:hypothetical protein